MSNFIAREYINGTRAFVCVFNLNFTTVTCL